jgi:glycyl-tRNA synthetase beta chain
MAELLVELLSEEIPARMQARAAETFGRSVTEGLAAAGLEHGEARSFVTPRRLSLVVEGLPREQPDIVEEKKGPKVGAPEQALAGFMKANGLAAIDEAEVCETAKGDFYFAVKRIKGRPTREVLPGVILDAIQQQSWPKSMRWAGTQFRWVRQLQSILALFDGQGLAGTLEMGGGESLSFGSTTRGHRFMAPESFAVTDFAHYRDKLTAAKGMLDAAERRKRIGFETARLAWEADLEVKADAGLLEEVAGLVEWPVVLIGRIDDAFMGLPPEVLSTAMRHHQKYFSLTDHEGRLANRFLFVANMEAADGGGAIVRGNEKVLSARLSDARFFWEQDRKDSLASRVPALEEMVFHEKLGSLAEKVSRLQSLAVAIAHYLPGADTDRVRSAARLAKADLTSGMVGEFPELQGVMGRYYALNDQEHEEVAEAIAEHYSPLGPNDRCPSAPNSVAVALADKIDTLVGFWAIDERPTGSKDPYGLRRAALGVNRLIVENWLRLPLLPVLEAALKSYRREGLAKDDGGLSESLFAFLVERLKVALRDKGVRHDLISAVFAMGGEDDLVRLLARVDALGSFLASDNGANLLVAYRRAANIVRIEEKKDKASFGGPVDAKRLDLREEKSLFKALETAKGATADALKAEDFTSTMAAMAALRRPVDDFFDKVTVNAEDAGLRENRLRLLAGIGATLSQVADFSKIEG